MKLIRNLEAADRPPEGCVVTIGVFDGVHRGHLAVMRQVRELADQRGLRTALVTFDRHPAAIVHPGSAPKLLTTLEQRIELLDATGLLDYCCVLTFDQARRKETADEFVREILVDRMHARAVVVGADFHFGFRRQGNVALLNKLGGELGFDVVGLELVRIETDPALEGANVYSSTLVRALVASGNVGAASRLLGRPHAVRGEVVVGDRRGRLLGFPTANVSVPEETCLPADGIYVGTLVDKNGAERSAAISLGLRPTFHDDQVSSLLEAHVLDFESNLYGQTVEVRFVARLRGEERFSSPDDLVAQVHRDVEATREALKHQ